MKLIVGLGNPGKIYTDSRHNIGFQVVKSLAKFYRVAFKKDKDTFSLSAKIKIDGQNVILALPLTFMNLSGMAVSALVKKYKIGLENLLVICDDLDLEFGRIKIRALGSSAGHQGLQSIIDSQGRQNFARLRVGIGRPQHKNIDTKEFVLSAFTKKEKDKMKEIIESAMNCCQVWLSDGIFKSMNMFNRRR